MPLKDEQNYFHLTSEFVQHTSQNIFLTGKAGTGKTTFLKHIKEQCKKNLVVVAPTGVAAINAGGVTAHSFFQLPLGTFIPGSIRGAFDSLTAVTDRHHLLYDLRMNNEKRDMIQSLELIIIDEVSMLRCDMLDAIDTVLRHVRRNQRTPFGGVQMLFIGDLYQLPPVVKDADWVMMKNFYNTPFFFGSQVFKQAKPLCIELKKVYRQSDENFIHLLNRIRSNQADDDDLEKLQQRYNPVFRPNVNDHFITLTTHNYKADDINARELKRLDAKEFICEATVEREFPDRNFPVEKTLRLKPGAQIMFVRNDTEEKKYFNGKVGVVKDVSKDEKGEFIGVEFPEIKEVIHVRKVTWQNIRYSFNETENKIDQKELGSFTQYPIRLAWAVTIHKSQGLTFQRAMIDAGQAFAAGQVYVALSRCVSLEGIVLLSPIRNNVIMTESSIVEFMQQQSGIDALLPVLEREKESFIIKRTMELFSLLPLLNKIQEMVVYMGGRKIEGKEKIISGIHSINEVLLPLQETAEKFQEQVKKITTEGLTDSAKSQLDERIEKAKAYFEKQLDEKLNEPLLKLNKELQQQNKVRKLLKEMRSFLKFFERSTNRFRKEPKRVEEKFSSRRTDEENEKYIETTTGQLFELLRRLRRKLSVEENVAPYLILQDNTLKEMETYLPQSISDMALIKGMGDRKLKKYGEAFLSTIKDFCAANGLHSKMESKETNMSESKIAKRNKPAAEGDTRSQSFQLFKSGKSISDIAVLREFAEGTIQTHLTYFIETGELDVFQFLTKEKFEVIKTAIQTAAGPGTSAIKNKLGDEVSYGEIRFVIAALNCNKNGGTS